MQVLDILHELVRIWPSDNLASLPQCYRKISERIILDLGRILKIKIAGRKKRCFNYREYEHLKKDCGKSATNVINKRKVKASRKEQS